MVSSLPEEQQVFFNEYNKYIQLVWNKGCQIISECDEASLQRVLEYIECEVAKV